MHSSKEIRQRLLTKRINPRWAYMSRPGFKTPDTRCPECTEPSRSFYIGGKTVDGKTQHRYQCEHGHEWTERNP